MGKQTDRMYMTMSEWMDHFGGMRSRGESGNPFLPLPFYCCSLSLQPFDDPVATDEGVIFDIKNVLPWLKKYKMNPITGSPLASKDLFPLQFHKDKDDKFICPITFKEFTPHSHIVAVKTSGHVYSYDALEEMNIKRKHWKDLLTEIPFTRKDIITIQDPKNMERKNLANFHFIKKGLKLSDDAVDPLSNIALPETTKNMLRSLEAKHDKIHKEKVEKEKADQTLLEEYHPESVFVYVDAEAPGFTASTFSDKQVKVDAREIIRQVDKKAYVTIHTSLGDLNIEVHSDIVPKTSENFLALSEKGYYNGTKFHRLVPGKLIQGGDPKGTGRGGESIWGKPFKDEFSPKLQHSGRGIVSMANTGKDSNTSQFFITFTLAPQLNLKHSVFGKVVGGNEVLSKMEKIRSDFNEMPLDDIILERVTVWTNPFRETKEEKEAAAKKKEQEELQKKADMRKGEWYSNPFAENTPKALKAGVGKYIGSSKPSEAPVQSGTKRPLPAEPSGPTKKPAQGRQYGNFSNW